MDAVTSFRNNSSSSTQNLKENSCSELQFWSSLFFIVLHSLLFLVGLCLNGVSLRVYFFSKAQTQSNSVTVYLKNLVVADLLLSLSLPIRIAHYATNPALYASDPSHPPSSPTQIWVHWLYCSFGVVVFYLNMYASVLFMGHIATNRYLKIMRPLVSHFLQTPKGVSVVSALTWLFLVVLGTPYMVLSVLKSQANDTASHNVSLSCDASQSSSLKAYYRAVHICSATTFFCVLVALIIFYSSISRRLRQAQSRQPQSSSSNKLAKAQRNMLLLAVVFCVCFVPYHIIRLPYAFQKGPCFQSLYLLKELSVLLSVLNVCLDPLIYFRFSKAFRSQLGLSGAFSMVTANANEARSKHSSDPPSRVNRRGSEGTNKLNTVI